MTWGHLADILVSFSVPLISHILLTSSLTTDACIQYEYSGCGGNSNTFVTEEVFFDNLDDDLDGSDHDYVFRRRSMIDMMVMMIKMKMIIKIKPKMMMAMFVGVSGQVCRRRYHPVHTRPG